LTHVTSARRGFPRIVTSATVVVVVAVAAASATAAPPVLIAQAVLDDDIVVVDAALGFDPIAALVVVTVAAVHDRGGER
jgi:hypothetical protein